MPYIKIPHPWQIREALAAPEHLYLSRRSFIRAAGFAAAGGLLAEEIAAQSNLYPAKRNTAYRLDRDITKEEHATQYNNFAEFDSGKEVFKFVDRFQPRPWTVAVSGLVGKPQTFDIDHLIRRFPLEERLYRMRCVEGWSIAVPWTGFPLKALIDAVEPKPEARYLRLTSFLRPDQAPGQKANPTETWPRFQGLSIPEAMNELTMLVTGIYGHELPKQSGAPIRLVVPWKYGFKSIKSITSIEFVAAQPQAYFNNQLMPASHFIANVNPAERYLNRPQKYEKVIGTFVIRPTELYNGYGRYVAHLYSA